VVGNITWILLEIYSLLSGEINLKLEEESGPISLGHAVNNTQCRAFSLRQLSFLSQYAAVNVNLYSTFIMKHL